MAMIPASMMWFVRDWEPTGKKRYRRAVYGLWAKYEVLILQIEETGELVHMSRRKDGRIRTRWRDAMPSDLCGELA